MIRPLTPRRLISVLIVLLIMLMRSASSMAADFLDPEQAFVPSAELTANHTIALHWKIARKYKLYRDQVKVSVTNGEASLGKPVFPEGILFTDPSTGEKQVIYHDELKVDVPIKQAAAPFTVSIEYQGCSEDGLCYPPVTTAFRVDPSKPGPLAIATAEADDSGSAGLAPAVAPTQPETATPADTSEKSGGQNDMSLAQSTLEGGSWWKISAAFLLFGLLLSFTPCVLPMVPILSSIIVGEGESTKAKSFLMAVAYCLGMALVYTSLGVAAGLAGEGLAGALQKPWVLVMFSLLLIGLSLSMFDVYQLQVPASLQNSLSKTSGKLKGGCFVGVFFMGAISALIVGPCVAAPLAGTLVYISQTKDVVIGGLALFSMAMGMSVPLLLIGLSAGSLLPKAGAWMIGVKYVFGLMLIAVAIWMVTPVLPPQALMVAWGALGILCAVFAGLFGPPAEKLTIGGKFTKALGLVLFIIGVMELAGAASGATNPLEPLAGLRGGSPVAAANNGETAELAFKRIRSAEDLDRELQASAGKPVMLDFYADWCVSCKEMEKFTFSDPKVQQALEGVTLLQADVTANTADDKALMKRFNLFGPPGIIFFDKSGQEQKNNRIVGFVEAEEFLGHLKKL
ncbi:protein-disulfide reductase DsbD [Chlorobaculum sp. MV4-Y]|jgi:thiol:disulfide interchange protein DsbD|uniref:protein-disulfide reductase DsbD n=1 Tax=Chlorobaculum sp. MV4-Y TaxID=2976335 RepID=UPI0021AFE2FB|nr:protein-disulfide reductase DsbD [Chlorobaculum sp. MV4-Y]UWX58535.1 protein-disulfide reductase DsbD [Chlorobaculum sp. MV4-Y]